MASEKVKLICTKCGAYLFTYYKYGKTRIWECWKNRIFDDNTIHNFNLIKCQCGNNVGIDVGDYIKMKPTAFTF
ncbi:MAG: hypothetical protein ACTSO9_01225 [Candidatus Helarchaeota archaeon]